MATTTSCHATTKTKTDETSYTKKRKGSHHDRPNDHEAPYQVRHDFTPNGPLRDGPGHK